MLERTRDHSAQLAAIVASLDDAVISKDLTGKITWWNGGAERLFGYSADEAIGRSVDLIVPPDRLAEEAELLGRVSRGERVPGWETVRRRKDGSHVQTSVTLSPVYAEDGSIHGATSISRDITARTQMEAVLLDSQRRLSALATASAMVAGSTDVDAVLTMTIELAREVFLADGYAVWRDVDGVWAVWQSWGLSQEFAGRFVSAGESRPPASSLPFQEPLSCPDVAALPMLEGMRRAYAAEGVVSMLVFPLRLRGTLGA